MRFKTRNAVAGLLVAAIPATASAQFGNEWIEFEANASMLSAGTISDIDTETDIGTADADNDGWTDMAIVRKQPFTSAGKRTNLFLRNVNGTLTDTTSQHAGSSDVAGDNGFLTATNDRDVIFVDVQDDGMLDMVIAVTLSDGEPKHMGHPRIYVNLGGATWQGFQHQDARMPTLFHFGTGNMQNPRFCSVAGGDVTGNGVPDLYFGDYDSSGAGGVQQGSNEDMNDRLLINDGSGFYADESQSRMTSDMLLSAFGMASEMADMNLDGVTDVIKDTALNPPQDVRVIYNNPAGVGSFNIQDKFHTGFAPYHIDVDDLNNDGRPDLIVSDDNDDAYRFNQGVDALGRVIWGPSQIYGYADLDDDGFGSNCLIVDLDGDGWAEALHADVDVDIGGYTRRLHIYHNLGGVPGSPVDLFEEREEEVTGGGGPWGGGGGTETGWIGVVGLEDDDLEGTHDVGVLDIDNDGDMDMVVSRSAGTVVWDNISGGGTTCGLAQYGLGVGGANIATLASASTGQIGTQLSMDVSGYPNDGVASVFLSRLSGNTPLFGGTILVSISDIAFTGTTATVGGAGSVVLMIPDNSVLVGLTFYAQSGMLDLSQPGGWVLSNGLSISPCP